MKITLMALFIASLVTVLAGDSKDTQSQKEGDQWSLPEPAYGQFRLVPSRVIPHITELGDWNGPWSTFRTFVIQLDFSKGHSTSPRDYHFVDPNVGLQGSDLGRRESNSTSVSLFDRESTEKDIKITFYAAPDKIQLNQEYLAATIFGDDSIVTWKVFVRFTAEKPSYIRASHSGAIK